MTQITIIRAMPVADISLQGDGRSVVFKLLSYNRDYTVSDDGIRAYVERWKSGAFRRSLTHNGGTGLPMTYEHNLPGQPRALPVGGSKRLWEDGDSLMLEGRISRTSVGDDLVELLRDGVVQGVSVDTVVFRSVPFVGGIERSEARLRAIAMTCAPQYDDAGLVAMRSESPLVGGFETPRLDAIKARMEALNLG